MPKKAFKLLFFTLLILFSLSSFTGFSEEQSEGRACIIPVKGIVDKGLSGFIVRAIEEAKESECQIAIFEIDTFGGRVDAAVEIRDAILDAPFEKTVAYINKRAISAGALIALSNKDIYMAEGGTIGAAAPVQIGGTGEASPVGEKYVSYLRKEFKTTAEKNGYPAELAEAFVDSDVEIEGIIEKEKLLTLTSKEAKEHKLARDIIPTREELLEKLGLYKGDIHHYKMNWSEVLVRIFTHPVISSLLLTFGFLGMIFELRMPGFGITGIIGVTCLLLFFLGHYLIGMAEWLDILLFVTGTALLLVEILVIPGFGICGVAGIICLVSGVVFSMVKREVPGVPVPMWQYENALKVLLGSFFTTGFFTWLVFKYLLPMFPTYNKLFLSTTLERQTGANKPKSVKEYEENLLEKTGTAYTDLRPAGKMDINGTLYDVVSDNIYINKGTKIIIREVSPTRIVVEELKGEKA